MTVHMEFRHYPEPELVIVEIYFKGKHVGDFFSLMPTNRDINILISVFITLKNGLISGERFYFSK